MNEKFYYYSVKVEYYPVVKFDTDESPENCEPLEYKVRIRNN